MAGLEDPVLLAFDSHLPVPGRFDASNRGGNMSTVIMCDREHGLRFLHFPDVCEFIDRHLAEFRADHMRPPTGFKRHD